MNGPDGKRFPWGRIVETHHIGDLEIVEAVWGPTHGQEYAGKTGFFAYVGGKDMGRSAPTLDGAIIAAIACKYDGYGSHAAHYIAKVLGLPTE